MALLSSSKNKDAPQYVAVPSFLITPSIAEDTNKLLDTLRREHATLSDETKAKENERGALHREYKPVTAGSVTFAGRTYRSGETNVTGELTKAKADQDKKAAKVRAHNEGIKAKQEQLQAEGNKIAVKMHRVNALIDIVNKSAHGPMLYDAAALLVTRTPEERLIALSVLTKGAAVAFCNGEYVTRDIRLVSALMDTPSERIELIK